MKFLIFSLLFQSTFSLASSNGKYEFKLDKELKSLVVDATKGKLSISTHKKEEAQVTVNRLSWGKDCTESVVHFGPTLTVKVKSDSVFSKEECKVNIEILVPEKIDLDISTGAMDTNIKGIEGMVEFSSASGDLTALGKFSQFDAKIASSDISIDGLIADAKIVGASSDMKLVYSECPKKKAKLEVKRASGDLELFVPKSCKLKTVNRQASGDAFNEFGDSMEPHLEVLSVSASGDLKIKKL